MAPDELKSYLVYGDISKPKLKLEARTCWNASVIGLRAGPDYKALLAHPIKPTSAQHFTSRYQNSLPIHSIQISASRITDTTFRSHPIARQTSIAFQI